MYWVQIIFRRCFLRCERGGEDDDKRHRHGGGVQHNQVEGPAKPRVIDRDFFGCRWVGT